MAKETNKVEIKKQVSTTQAIRTANFHGAVSENRVTLHSRRSAPDLKANEEVSVKVNPGNLREVIDALTAAETAIKKR